MIPYARQDINAADIAAVGEVLKSNLLTQGPVVPIFEQEVANKCSAQYAIAVNSATSALHLACLAMDLGPGDWLWTSPITFVASANCALYCGARVDFVDIDKLTFNLCANALEQKLIQAERDGCLPKIVVPVHFAGQPCDMKAIHALSQRYGFKIIEDASHAIGGAYQGAPIGNCYYSDVTVFSFHPVKIITSGEGGMVLTNNELIAERVRLLRSHGITRDAAFMTELSPDPWYYEQLELGFNYRMTDIHAALGLSQLQRLEDFVTRRHQLAQRYNENVSVLPLIAPYQAPGNHSSMHLYVIQLNKTHITRSELFNAMRKQEIIVNVHYFPVHLQPYYKKLGFKEGQFPAAEHYYSQAITLPLYPAMSNEQQDRVIAVLHDYLANQV
jgi:UDP-4-amino-4,6-dideoxy-N-acetyl-beta-L-altrosamine transaminase